MAAPFFDAIKAGVTGTPGTGAITIGTVVSGFRAFSNVPSNTVVNYRAEDGTSWELGIGLWNGTTLTRGLITSSSGSLISLTSAATVALQIPADEVQTHIGAGKWGLWQGRFGLSTGTSTGLNVPTTRGTGGASTAATTSYLARMPGVNHTSATTANALAGIEFADEKVSRSATAFMGGFDYVARFGASQIPTGPRLIAGLSAAAMTTGEPSALTDMAAFIKDSTDTNIQFVTNDASGTATKTDTGIPFVANSGYEASVWNNPGEAKICGSLVRLDTGATYYGEKTSDLPTADTLMQSLTVGGLSATTGTAIILKIGSHYLKSTF